MDHIDEWKVDWDMDLTRREIALVKDPVWRAGLSQQYYKPARDAYNNWCVKYGIVPTDVKFAIFHKNYVLMLSKRPQHSLSEKSINLVIPTNA